MTFSFELSNYGISILFGITFVGFFIIAWRLDKIDKKIKELEKEK